MADVGSPTVREGHIPVEAGEVAARPLRRRDLFFAHLSQGPVANTALAMVVALLAGAGILIVSNGSVLHASSPIAGLTHGIRIAADAYYALFQGAVLDPSQVANEVSSGALTQVFTPVTTSLAYATPLILAGLAVTLAFRAGLLNIGVQGQMIVGGMAAAWVGFALKLPPGLHLTVALVAAMVAGAIWGVIPGMLKARTGAHEVITTLMLSYVAVYLLQYALVTKGYQRPGRTDPISRIVHLSARLPHMFGSGIALEGGIFIALGAAVGVVWLLSRSTVGFELRASGANPHAARTAGINLASTYAIAFALAGACSGLAGADQVLGQQYTLTPGFDGGIGFTAITVALVGRATPLGTTLAAVLFGALEAGGQQMQVATQTPYDLVTIIQAFVVLFIVAPALVRALLRVPVRVAPKRLLPGVSQTLSEDQSL